MESVKELISENLNTHPDFDYYFVAIEKAKNNLLTNPDISIEASKALIEGISKSILKQLDNTYSSDDVDGGNLSPLVKKAMQELARRDETVEEDFITRSCSLIHIIGEIRNKRGDISHGKHAPKDFYSDIRLSRLILNVAEGLSYYLLKTFYSIDLSYKQKTNYDEYQDFNDELDGLYNYGNEVKYSKALYDQAYVAYFQELTTWLSRKDEEA